MKKHALSAAVVVGLLQIVGCGDETRLEAIKFPLDQSFTTAVPIDPGTVHNEILMEMGAASIPAGTLTSGEYVKLLMDAANRTFSRYGASRELTADDFNAVLDIGRAISPLYDFQFEDSSRADPVRVIRYWYDHDLLNYQEFVQLQQLFAKPPAMDGGPVSMSIANEPASKTVAAGASVLQASMDYWGQFAPLPPPDRMGVHQPLQGGADEIRRLWADALGGAIGGLVGGVIGSSIVGAGTSTLFMIHTECWPGPCQGDDIRPPDPCGGYRGIGPCP